MGTGRRCSMVCRFCGDREIGELVLVEGESDQLTLRQHDIAALGVPGASMARLVEAEHVAGIRTLFVVKEPDHGGETFVRGLTERLQQIGFDGTLRVVDIAARYGFKDPAPCTSTLPNASRNAGRALLLPPSRLALKGLRAPPRRSHGAACIHGPRSNRRRCTGLPATTCSYSRPHRGRPSCDPATLPLRLRMRRWARPARSRGVHAAYRKAQRAHRRRDGPRPQGNGEGSRSPSVSSR